MAGSFLLEISRKGITILWTQTRGGKKFTPLNPKQEDITIEDIAWHLSLICRYTGATKYLYSVAQHSIYISYLVSPEYALEGLLHDASEAYLNDITRPVKLDRRLEGYCEIEDIVSTAIATKFNLQYPFPDEVKYWDHRILANEKRDLFDIHHDWGLEFAPVEELVIVEFRQRAIYQWFLDRYHELVER